MLKPSLLLLATCALSQTVVSAYQVELPYHVSVQPVTDYTNSSGKILEKPLLAYFSIPFAEPPVGKLRYQFPVEPKNKGKKTVLSNKDYGNVCSQPIANPPVPQGEDCLTLSIFKPQYTNSSTKLPVVIWTPGGAFNTGGGRGLNVPSMVGNAPQDFIGVSTNYRLGAFGFLPSSLTYRAGLLNLGLADQVRAYEWVKEHIELFGGDADKITVSTYCKNKIRHGTDVVSRSLVNPLVRMPLAHIYNTSDPSPTTSRHSTKLSWIPEAPPLEPGPTGRTRCTSTR